jgi:hypothetical protein
MDERKEAILTRIAPTSVTVLQAGVELGCTEEE